ncbi:MAG: hypothetical protein CXT64_02125 [Methanobacteriota archaeon]|nr:MAG: hypothetical protein CXT64_02125 [Euryarchaeota archaeon]
MESMGRAEVLGTIKDAEDDAEKIRASADEKAKSLLSDARVKAAEAITAGRQSADEGAASILNDARAASEKVAAAVSDEGDALLAQVTTDGEQNREAAVDAVLSAFRTA